MLIDDPKVEASIREIMALTGKDEETVVLVAVTRMLERIRTESIATGRAAAGTTTNDR